MKIIQSTLFRALCSIITGVLLIKYREETVTWITIAIGVMFLISGIMSCITYFVASKQTNTIVYDATGKQLTGSRPPFPIVGIGSLVLGLILVVMPSTFVTWLIYMLAGLLIVGAIGQFANLVAVSRIARVGLMYWVMPSVILLVGLISIIHPSAIAGAPLFVIGWCMLLYGVSECVNAVKTYRLRKICDRTNNTADTTGNEAATDVGTTDVTTTDN